MDDVYQAAERTVYLLRHRDEAKRMGEQGKEHVRKNFLIVNDLKDYLKLFIELEDIALQTRRPLLHQQFESGGSRKEK